MASSFIWYIGDGRERLPGTEDCWLDNVDNAANVDNVDGVAKVDNVNNADYVDNVEDVDNVDNEDNVFISEKIM